MTFYQEIRIDPGLYELYSPNVEDGLIEVGSGIWVTEGYGCYSLYGEMILNWNGYTGKICDRDNFNSIQHECE